MATLAEKIAAAKANTPIAEKKERPKAPENAYQISGFWQKGGDFRSWVAKIKGLSIDPETGDEKLVFEDGKDENGNYIIHNEIEWKSGKGESPEGIKTFYLLDGIYKGIIHENKKDTKGKWHNFAVVNGKREDLAEEVVFSIFQS